MNGRKTVFFDIDGTIWNENNEIPESTVEAIRKLRENGHLAFLCSGRSRAFIRDPKLLGIGFDGIISGCGTMIEYNGETVFYKKLDRELVEHTIRTVRKYGARPVLEGKDHLYMDDEEFADDYFGLRLREEMGESLLQISDEWGKWEVSKVSCATENCDREACFRALEEYYDFMIHNACVVEMVPKGCHKGTGIENICRILGTDLADTYAFGDSVNDLGMMQTVGTGVAMGNGSDAVKAAADYVTDSLMEDGIRNACRHFGLI